MQAMGGPRRALKTVAKISALDSGSGPSAFGLLADIRWGHIVHRVWAVMCVVCPQHVCSPCMSLRRLHVSQAGHNASFSFCSSSGQHEASKDIDNSYLSWLALGAEANASTMERVVVRASSGANLGLFMPGM